VVAALQEQLLTAEFKHLVYFLSVLVYSGDIRFIVSGTAVKITKFAIRNTDIGRIGIPVDDPCHFVIRDMVLPELVGHKHQFRSGCIFKEKHPFFGGEPLQMQGAGQ
jgi:hypothetical protein